MIRTHAHGQEVERRRVRGQPQSASHFVVIECAHRNRVHGVAMVRQQRKPRW